MNLCRDISIPEAAALLRCADDLLLLCHQKPDGDTLGSAFGLCYGLRKLGKRVRIESPDGFPDRYRFMYPDADPAGWPAFEPRFIAALDVADARLLGGLAGRYGDRIDLCIDHHLSNLRYARALVLDPEAAGTVDLVVGILDELGVEPDKLMATCLYTGLATDTGCFRYSNTTADSHRLAARLIDLGAAAYDVNKAMFETKSVGRMELERLALDTLEYHFEKRLAVISISADALAQTGVPETEMEGIAGIPRQIVGVEMAVTFMQKGERLWRVSVRTNQRLSASALCSALGGGGHIRAAGCTLTGTLPEVKAQVLRAAAPCFGSWGGAK